MSNIAKPYLMENSLIAVGTKDMTFLGMVDSDCEYVQIYTDDIYTAGQYLSYKHVDVFEPFDDVFLANTVNDIPSLYQRDYILVEPIMYGDEMNKFFVDNKNIVLVGPARENRFINYCHRALTFFGIDSILPLSASAENLVVSSPGCFDYFKGMKTKRLHEIEDHRIDNAGFVICASTTRIGENTLRELNYAESKDIPGFDLYGFTYKKNKIFNDGITLRIKGDDQND